MASKSTATATADAATAPAPAPAGTTVREIPREKIIVDRSLNARQKIDPEHAKGIAMSMKHDGQLQAIGVRERKDGNFDLLFGFTRYLAKCGPKADGFLDQPTIRAEVYPATMSALDAYFNNLIENVARKDLSTHSLAARVAFMEKEYKLTGAKIAGRLGLTPKYVNNLIRIYNSIAPAVMERWAKECGDKPMGDDESKVRACNLDWLSRHCKLNAAEQESALNKALGLTPADDADADADDDADADGDGAGGGDSGSVTPARATMKVLKSAAEKIKESIDKIESGARTEKNAEWVKLSAMAVALDFAMGKRKSVGPFKITA